MLKEITPEELKSFQIVAVHKLGDYWNWRKFRVEPVRYTIFTANGIFEYIPD